MQARTKAETRRQSNWFTILLVEWSASNFGQFAVLTTLSIYLVRILDLSPGQAAWLMLLSILPFNLTQLFLTSLLNRFPARLTILASSGLSCLGYLGLMVAKETLVIATLLTLVGTGYGTNALAVKALAAHADNVETSTLLRYALLNTGLNIAAALGPILGSALFLYWQPRGVFLLASVACGTAFLITLSMPSTGLGTFEKRDWMLGLRLSTGLPALRQAMLFTAIGFFLYTQFYAILPLFVSASLGVPHLLGTFFGLNSVLIVVGQLPLSKLTMRRCIQAPHLVQAAYLAFACGFALMWLWPFWQVVYGAVILWTLAEMMLMPALDVLVAEHAPPEYRIMAFALKGVAIGVGEGLGNLVGVWLAGLLLQAGAMYHLYGLLALMSMGAVVAMVPVRRKGKAFNARK